MSRYLPLGKTRTRVTALGDRITTQLRINLEIGPPLIIEHVVIDTPAKNDPQREPHAA